MGHGSWTMFGMDPHVKAAVDNKPDRRRVRPANLSKVGAETSSLHAKQSFKAQSGAGPLLGSEFVLFVPESEKNRSLSVTGKSYHLLESDDEVPSVAFVVTSILSPLRVVLLNPSPPNMGKVGSRTHEPKQFDAVFHAVSEKIIAQSFVIPSPR